MNTYSELFDIHVSSGATSLRTNPLPFPSLKAGLCRDTVCEPMHVPGCVHISPHLQARTGMFLSRSPFLISFFFLTTAKQNSAPSSFRQIFREVVPKRLRKTFNSANRWGYGGRRRENRRMRASTRTRFDGSLHPHVESPASTASPRGVPGSRSEGTPWRRFTESRVRRS